MATSVVDLTMSTPTVSAHKEVVTRQPQRLDNIQLLRALAATMVVLLHTQFIIALKAKQAGLYFPRFDAINLSAGVDLFFVISGFIIVYASESLFGTGRSLEFLRRRLLRIVPLWWAALSLRLVVLGLLANAGLKTFPDASKILCSFFFIPTDGMGFGPDYPFPILDLGWSLNYEMLFYVVFALLLGFRREAAVATMAGLLLISAVVASVAPPGNMMVRFWTHPLTLEFAAGAGLAVACRRGVKFDGWVSGALAIGALLWWWLPPIAALNTDVGPGSYSWGRVIASGTGAVMLVAAGTLCEQRIRLPLRAHLVRLGDSSYSQYLIHPFILLVAADVLKRLPLTTASLWPLTLMIVMGIIVAAHLVHLWFERPVIAALQAVTDRRRPPHRVLIDAR